MLYGNSPTKIILKKKLKRISKIIVMGEQGTGKTCNTQKIILIHYIFRFSVDIDECRERRSGCSQECENTIGSYVCRCSKGYEMMPNGRYCRGRNEQNILLDIMLHAIAMSEK